jgi:hypothetical protein
MSEFDDPNEIRYLGMYDGVVVDNADPEGLGRIRVMIPGLVEPESAWAEPVGAGGSAQRGRFDVPEKGATVTVHFLMGDIDRPKYHHGYYGKPGGKSEAPTAAQGIAPADADKVKVYETEDFEILIDGRSGKHHLRLTEKKKGTRIEIDGNGVVTVTADKILLGSPQASEPVVLGNKWLNMMGQLFTALLAHTHLTAIGPSAPSTELPASLGAIQLPLNLSKKDFGE